MDTLISRAECPVFVDLDGTLIRSDLLWETLFLFARQEPLQFWRVFAWLAKGKAVLKDELAARVEHTTQQLLRDHHYNTVGNFLR